MSLKKQIEDNLNKSLKAKDKKTYPTLRLIVSAIKDAEIAGRSKGQEDIKDNDIIALLKKMIKQRKESCEVYKKAGRTELLENENREIEVINKFLPNQLSEEETKKICEETIKSVNAKSMKDMGKVISKVNEKVSGQAEGRVIAEITKTKLMT